MGEFEASQKEHINTSSLLYHTTASIQPRMTTTTASLLLGNLVERNVLKPLSTFPEIVQKLASEAVRVSVNGYAPYSLFTVGAALLHEDASITAGCNYENAVFQSSCAERCAILAANANGKRRSAAIAVYGKSIRPNATKPNGESICPPCGVCRQFLVEVEQLSECELDVVLVSSDTQHAKIVKLGTLLPESFGPKDLGMDLAVWGHGNPQ